MILLLMRSVKKLECISSALSVARVRVEGMGSRIALFA